MRRILALSIAKRFFVTSFLRMTYTEGAPERIQDFCQGFFPCHPERMRRIFALSIAKRFFVTSFLRMTYTEGAPERIQDFCQGFFPCHPERMRRIFALSIAKRFFVTSFLRMTYTGASYYICEARFYYAPTVFSTRSRHSSASAQPTTETAMQTSSILLTPTASISVPPSA